MNATTTASALPGLHTGDAPHGVLAHGFAQGSARQNLQQLAVLRNIAVVGQLVTILVCHHGLGIQLPLVPLVGTVFVLALFNAWTWRRLGKGSPVTDREFLVQLLADVVALAVLLGLSGGATNPFVGMFLLPLAITAASLPWSHAWGVALFTMALHSLLVIVHRPLLMPGEEARFVPLLVAGMWVNYAVTAGMVAHFVVRISARRREGEQIVGAAREREMCNEHVVRIGALAAGAAHELAQPLAALSVMVGELSEQCAERDEIKPTVDAMSRQIANCGETLGALLEIGRSSFPFDAESEGLDIFARRAVDAFRARRPDANVVLRVEMTGDPPRIHHDIALRQALLNLLGNAADVSPGWIGLRIGWNADQLMLRVLDRGPGFAREVLKAGGRRLLSTKLGSGGHGLGLCLAYTAVARLGGTLRLSNNVQGGGACAEIVLPRPSMSAGVATEGAAR